MAYQTLECDRRGGLAARERREELSDPVPVLCDPIAVRLLRFATALRVTAPLGCGSRHPGMAERFLSARPPSGAVLRQVGDGSNLELVGRVRLIRSEDLAGI